MTSIARVQARPGQRALLITTLAVPLTGWTVHAVALHRQLANAHRDPLTGAQRRAGFERRAQHLIDRYGDTVMVALIDLDHFKALNDGHGHAAGDRALTATGERLIEWAGSRGVVGRLGGDEFAVATRIGPSRRAVRLAQLARTLSEPVDIDGHPVDVAASVGAATPDTLRTRDLSALLRGADAAMYAGKHTGTPVVAGPEHANVASINGRRAGRPGTHATARAA
ncbi:GGDEF domain-containing protein [Streptomyces sp. ITFR-16]|uniref:GGDEF domain-containing protein n=1 Tax=Streptomyces sp. ITFR-16 TaxID=3075198 RepID=UPI00288B2E93|nr:GGDEF domain-containing protein [Streptomyces sp. ITFR-16]WNI27330.1 GGDEF domain-containing protein [Streptomyces sp. ITFR-16]